MNQEIIKTISEELNVRVHQIEAVLSLLEEGNTVPFIARYRKEKTGALDEDQIRTIDKYYQYQVNLLKRKEDVIRLIDEKGMLNEKLKTDILKATQLSEVEDLYRPYKEKRKTKATAAKAKGLEPLAKWILALNKGDILVEAKKYLNDDVLNVEDAIQGALDIIAEDIADDIKYRKFLKDMLYKGGILKTSEKKKHDDENKVYEMYYNYQEKVKTLVSHRILAINRADCHTSAAPIHQSAVFPSPSQACFQVDRWKRASIWLKIPLVVLKTKDHTIPTTVMETMLGKKNTVR